MLAQRLAFIGRAEQPAPLLPAMLDVFSLEVIPRLQRRGLFRTAYEGKTLREHYGLAWPKSAFKEAALQEA